MNWRQRGEIAEADDGGVDRFRREPGEEGLCSSPVKSTASSGSAVAVMRGDGEVTSDE